MSKSKTFRFVKWARNYLGNLTKTARKLNNKNDSVIGILGINKNSKYICSALTIDKKIIASIVGRIDKENYYYLIPSTNESVAMKYSPGRILLNTTILKNLYLES